MTTVTELPRTKSQLTAMLGESSETRNFHDVFAAVPRSAGTDPESTPDVTIPVPRGLDFALTAAGIGVVTMVFGYVLMVGIGLISAFANMLGGSCGQETWKMDASEACSQLLTNALAFSIELRCHGAKPEGMAAETLDEVCGFGALVGMLIALVAAVGFIVWQVGVELGKMPSKVSFHDRFLVVESVSGKAFECIFYADVTSAKITWDGLCLGTKAKVSLAAGGADEQAGDKLKDGKVLRVNGDSSLTVLCGDGAARDEFLKEFAAHLPVRIEGWGAAEAESARVQEFVPPDDGGSASILDGRLGELLKARKADSSSYEHVRKPLSCDLCSEIVIVTLIILVCWYAIATFSMLIGWVITKGTGKCLDPMKPGEDMCAVWRIFTPLNVPIVTPSDYINLAFLICGVISAPIGYVARMPVEHRFHQSELLQELQLAGRESQESTMIFASDVEAIELVEGSMEKCVKLRLKTYYTIKNGINKPFTVTAKFVSKDHKVGVVDGDCASCSGHRPQAVLHRENLLRLLQKMKPGFSTVVAEDSAQ